VKRQAPVGSGDGDRLRGALKSMLLRTLFWIVVAVALFFYFKFTA
jgi:hypothetical protein